MKNSAITGFCSEHADVGVRLREYLDAHWVKAVANLWRICPHYQLEWNRKQTAKLNHLSDPKTNKKFTADYIMFVKCAVKVDILYAVLLSFAW